MANNVIGKILGKNSRKDVYSKNMGMFNIPKNADEQIARNRKLYDEKRKQEERISSEVLQARLAETKRKEEEMWEEEGKRHNDWKYGVGAFGSPGFSTSTATRKTFGNKIVDSTESWWKQQQKEAQEYQKKHRR